jgi:Domain of unknown function (DUF4263)
MEIATDTRRHFARDFSPFASENADMGASEPEPSDTIEATDDRDPAISPEVHERFAATHDEEGWDPPRSSAHSGLSGHEGDELSDAVVRLYDRALAANSENDMQRFFIRYSVLLPTPFLRHHGIINDAVISKPHLTPHVISDFAYITGHSIEARIVFVELKSPAMRWFAEDKPRVKPHDDLVAALAQIDECRRCLQGNEDKWLTWLETLGAIFEAVEFRFVLIGGRSDDAHGTKERRAYLRSLAKRDSDTAFMTYDSVRNAFRKVGGGYKNVLVESKPGWRCRDLTYPLNYAAPAEYLSLTAEQRAIMDFVCPSKKPRWIGPENRAKARDLAADEYRRRIAEDEVKTV